MAGETLMARWQSGKMARRQDGKFAVLPFCLLAVLPFPFSLFTLKLLPSEKVV